MLVFQTQRQDSDQLQLRGDDRIVLTEKSCGRNVHTTFYFHVRRTNGLDYRQKFEVELSTFPDSTNTKTLRKLVFSLTCVCMRLCEKVCQWISYERIDRFG